MVDGLESPVCLERVRELSFPCFRHLQRGSDLLSVEFGDDDLRHGYVLWS